MDTDTRFTLQDLRVEVVAPEGAKLYCGAKVGDFFELRGEMLHLPRARASRSIRWPPCCPAAAKQRPTDANDWMTHRRRSGLSRSQLPVALSHHPHRNAHVSPRRDHGRGPSIEADFMNSAHSTIELAPGYSISRLLKGGWQLAGGHGEVDRARAIADMAPYDEAGITTFDCADIYTGVEEMIGEFRADYRAPWPRRPLEAPGAHQVRARPCAAADHRPAAGRADDRSIAPAPQHGAARSRPVALVGLRRAALHGGRALARRTAARRQDRPPGRHQFRHGACRANSSTPACRW